MAAKDLARSKAFERWIGAKLGARRRHSGEGIEFDDIVDVTGSKLTLSFECKAYAKLQLSGAWIAQAKRNAGKRPWVLVQRPKGSREVYATMDFELLLALLDLAGWEVER